MDVSLFCDCKDRVLKNCGKVIVGKDEVINLVFTSFLCSGHVLLEDVPGTGKLAAPETPMALLAERFDYVLTNPPFGKNPPSPSPMRRGSRRKRTWFTTGRISGLPAPTSSSTSSSTSTLF